MKLDFCKNDLLISPDCSGIFLFFSLKNKKYSGKQENGL